MNFKKTMTYFSKSLSFSYRQTFKPGFGILYPHYLDFLSVYRIIQEYNQKITRTNVIIVYHSFPSPSFLISIGILPNQTKRSKKSIFNIPCSFWSYLFIKPSKNTINKKRKSNHRLS